MSNYPTIIHNMNDITAMNLNPFGTQAMTPIFPSITPAQNQSNYKNVLLGKAVNNLSEIQPQDVPANGTKAIFPQTDDEVIYVKYIGSDCNVKTDVYVKKAPEQPIESKLTEANNDSNLILENQKKIEEILNQMNKINDRLNKLDNSKNNKVDQSKVKVTKEA